jgi:glycosyltransferase involved in cell wall biosynthesis
MTECTVIINNHNYGQFLKECIESVCSQEKTEIECFVVDDGSTDPSREIIDAFCRKAAFIHAIYKQNGGQASTFNAIPIDQCKEVICFLDSDDIYEPYHLKRTVDFYDSHPEIDFAFSNYTRFGQLSGVAFRWNEVVDFGVTAQLTRMSRAFIGGPTSTLSVRRSLLKKLLPIPFEENWRTRADDCLVFGASLLGCRKAYVPHVGVRYRVHDRNNSYRREYDSRYLAKRALYLDQLFNSMLTRNGLPYKINPSGLLHELKSAEYRRFLSRLDVWRQVLKANDFGTLWKMRLCLETLRGTYN